MRHWKILGAETRAGWAGLRWALLAGVLLSLSLQALSAQIITNVTAATGFALLTNRFGDTNFIVVDVRTPREYSSGHVKAALNVDFRSTEFREALMKLDRKRAYLLYCKSGARSASARDVMRGLNFTEIYNLTEGYGAIAAQPGARPYLE